jgi:hypothetical protein
MRLEGYENNWPETIDSRLAAIVSAQWPLSGVKRTSIVLELRDADFLCRPTADVRWTGKRRTPKGDRRIFLVAGARYVNYMQLAIEPFPLDTSSILLPTAADTASG